ncbi:MAG: hypothetical protein K2J15_04200, partial [Muribaculaceae bacterium]|nr:hypothetical protein [Muribaculaceae bacterium]
MKKKSLLISGLFVLGAVVGITSYAVTAGLPGISTIAEGDEDEPVYAAPTVRYPASDSYSLASFDINEAYMEFDGEVKANFSDDLKISLVQDKSTSAASSYATLYQWATTDTEHISLEGNKLVIKFGETLGNGVYLIDVPAGVVTVNGVPNQEYDHTIAGSSWRFTISAPVNPAADGTGNITYPANGAKVSSTDDVKSLWLNFAVGDMGIVINRECKGDVVITKDGEPLYSFPATDTAITTDRSWTGHLVIDLPEALEGGTYTVEVPEALVECKGLNAAYSWSFDVQAELPYEMSINPGGTYSFAQYATITITWPEGTKLAVNDGVSANLSAFNLGKNQAITDYTATAADNVLTLKAKDMSGMIVANNATTKYLNLEIPAGLVTITNGTESYQNSALKIEKLLSTAFNNDEFKILPDPSTPGLTLEDLQEITVIFPETSEYCGAKVEGSTQICQLYSGTFTGSGSISGSYYYNYLFKSISEDGKQVTATLAPQTEYATSTTNNRNIFQTGPTTVRVNQNLVCLPGSTNKNGYVNIPAYDMVGGLEIAPIYNSSPANYAGVSSISSLTLNFPKKVVVADASASITLSYKDQVIASCTAGQTTTAAAQPEAAGNTSVAFSNLFKIDGENITAPGIYTFHVPAGAFKQVDEPQYLNGETEIVAMIGQNISFETSPKTATFSGTKTALECTPGEEISELNTLTITYP